MPCYLFTYHAYGSWMPDRAAGYVRRKEGVLVADCKLAKCYRKNLKGDVVEFDERAQRTLISATREAFSFQSLRGHAMATDPTHVHILVSWNDERVWKLIRRRVRTSLTMQLNRAVEKRTWFAKQPSRKRVKDREHLNYLMKTYLPRHRGWKWDEHRGAYR